MNNQNHWLLDAIKEIEEYALINNITGLVEGLGGVLEIYAAEAGARLYEQSEITQTLGK